MRCNRFSVVVTLAVVAVVALVLTATSANAGIVFTDDFETPDVGTSEPIHNGVPATTRIRDTAKWVGATQGYGATSNGLLDEAGGAFTDPVGEQAYGFRYTNSGVTTAEGVIGGFEAGTYTVGFDVVRDDGFNAGTPYQMELVAFDPGDDRTECRPNLRPGTVLGSAGGNAPSDGTWAADSLIFTLSAGDASLGKDIGIRFIGATTSAIIDNVSLDAPAGGGPAPGLPVVILETDFTGRTVSGKTADNIPWTTDGVADPGDLTFVPEGPPLNTNLFDTANAQGHFAPDMNVDNESPWSVTIPLTLTAAEVSLEDVVIDWQHFTNTGAFQGANRSVDWTVSVTGSTSGLMDSVTAANISGTSGVETLTFTTPLTLTDSETWELKIHAVGNGPGNNTGLDALTVNGTISAAVPEPGTFALAALGLLGLAWYGRRRRMS